MDILNFLATQSQCGVKGLESILHYAVIVIRVIQIVVPIALIIWGSIDLLKGIIAQDDKKISATRKPFIQRLISALLIFLIPWIVDYVIKTFVSDGNSWKKCYHQAVENEDAVQISSDPYTFQ